jgi:hypothetical protein
VIAATAPLAFACGLAFGGGLGTQASPFQIATAAHLEALRDAVGTANESCVTSVHHFVQTASIDLAIGTADLSSVTAWTKGIGAEPDPFVGVYDGGDFTITGLTVALPDDTYYGGLFAATNRASMSPSAPSPAMERPPRPTPCKSPPARSANPKPTSAPTNPMHRSRCR